MSGPKYSEADLRRMEQERLERERQARLEKMRQELEKAREDMREAVKSFEKMERGIYSKLSDVKEKEDSYNFEKKEELVREIRSLSKNLSGKKEDLEERTKKLLEVQAGFKSRADEIARSNKETMIQSRIGDYEKDDDVGSLNIVFTKPIPTEEFTDLIEEVEAVDTLTEKDKKDIDNIIVKMKAMIETIDKEKVYELKKFSEILKSSLHSAVKRYEGMLSRYDEYVVKSLTLNYEPRDFADFVDEAELDRENRRLAKLIKDRDKMDYIADTIEEVMKEFGHEVVQSDIFDDASEAMVRTRYSYGDDGVISVTQSEAGSIVMQVGVTGDEEELSDRDTTQAVAKMKHFCTQYPELAKRFEEKGIIFRQTCNMPPDEAFAEKVVGVNVSKSARTKGRSSVRRRMTDGKLRKEV